ncbi:type II secretion system F family protein [Alloyangia pacifica]|uniref:Tight adherence protein C n=1 Tax=Alloyangia pacifica TaxID=311180 RepID=A0A1I6SSN9_9RHOB|nr:type II secretion system F family protein [Alloyangia pacifica]SDG86950.1 tight adherence protein C [Alloyangia pacifica]SFS79945.1 tight adherence protein C [Alloyangia pacifica]
MNEYLVLAAVFTAVLIATFAVLNALTQRRDVERNIESSRRRRRSDTEIDELLGTGNERLRYYLDVVKTKKKDSLEMRLVQAGFFSKSAVAKFNLIRMLAALIAFVALQVTLQKFVPSASRVTLLILAALAAALVFILASVVLERMAKKRMREFRKIFPDFMDLLLVCVDAGLSIDAAVDRVTREFLQTVPDFGVQLSIVNLEIRAGRPMHEALYNFSDRVQIEEARTLAVLFRQSEELGSSVSRTLRSFAREMRQMRIVKAEEKANALPVKMLFPMAFFMFPVSLIIVLVPITMTVIEILTGLAPK